MKGDRLEDILLDSGLINQEQLKKAKSVQETTGQNMDGILINQTMPNYKEVLSNIARKKGVGFIDLENISVNKDAVSKLNPHVARKYLVFPFDIKGNVIYLAMNNPDDIFAIDDIKVITKLDVKPFFADRGMIAKAIIYFYKIDGTENAAEEVKKEDAGKINMSNLTNQTNMTQMKPAHAENIQPKNTINTRTAVNTGNVGTQVNNTNKSGSYNGAKPVSNELSALNMEEYIKGIILKAIRVDATDIHIDSVNKNIRIRYRVDGKLLEVENDRKTQVNPESVMARIKILAGLFTVDKAVPQKGCISYDINKTEKIYLETLTLPTIDSEKILLKIDTMRSAYTIDDIGMTDFEKNLVETMFKRKSGMIIITGLNGSGKTTTAYALLKRFLAEDLNIITVEKKVSERIQGINQIQFSGKQDESLPNLIQAVIDHDPDMLFIDVDIDETLIKSLMSTALGGKLVILTQSFPSPYDAISGLINMGCEPYLVASSVEGIVAQQLVRRLCPSCQSKYSLLDLNEDDSENGSPKNFCDVCNSTGYKGKIGVFEVFHMSREYRKFVSKTGNLAIIEDMISKNESTFEKNAYRLVKSGITSVDEVTRIGLSKEVYEE